MAIEKIKKKKLELSARAITELSVSAALTLLSLIFGYVAFAKWRFKVNLVSAYENYAFNRAANARDDLQGALSWKPDHTGARELLAKILLEAERLEEAEGHYQQLLSQNYNPPQVLVGMGVLHLKKADREADAARAAEFAKQAENYFHQAGPAQVPEAAVGIGHCDLLRASRAPENAAADHLTRARAIFEKVGADLSSRGDYRAACTREGYIDYYLGRGKALAAAEGYDPQAAAAFRSAIRYRHRWVLPWANLLSTEAKRFVVLSEKASNQEMQQLKQEATALRKQVFELWRGQRDFFAGVKDPLLHYTLAVCLAWSKANNVQEYDSLLGQIVRGADYPGRLEPLLFDACAWTDWALRPDPVGVEQLKHVGRAIHAYEELLNNPVMKDEQMKMTRALAHNNQGWMYVWSGDFENAEARIHKARQAFQQALVLYPDDYIFNRNVAIALKRLKRPEGEIKPHVDKARAALADPKIQQGWATDFAGVEQYVQAR